MVTLLIGGDTVPSLRDSRLFADGDTEAIYGDLLETIQSADYFVLNGECPLTERGNQLPKRGPHLRASPECANGYRVANAVTLANNHILDYGAEGLLSTIESCRSRGIRTFGAGECWAEARKPVIETIKGMRIGFFGVAENEFASASEDSAGAWGFDLIDVVHNLREYKSQTDVRIILYHGGNEHFPYPNPRLQRVCRFLIEEGAHAVVCQHSHCPGCYEQYMNGFIVYGQGNLVFGKQDRRSPSWWQGFLVQLDVAANQSISATLIPYYQSMPSVGIRRMPDKDGATLLEEVAIRSQHLLFPKELDAIWKSHCAGVRRQYLAHMYLPHNRWLVGLNKRIGLIERLMSAQKQRTILNIVRCESHHEVIKTVLRNEL